MTKYKTGVDAACEAMWRKGTVRRAQRRLLKQVLLALVLSLAVIIALIYSASAANAQGWGWFLRHIHPTGNCGFGHEIIGSIYWSGRHNADGSRFHPDGHSAAHRTLPFGTMVTINVNGRSVTIPIKDRGPYIHGVHPAGAIDLSRGAARALGMRASQYVCASW